MLLDQTLDILTKSVWIFFAVVITIYFLRVLFEEGFSEAFAALGDRRILLSLIGVLAITAISLSLVFIEPQNVGVVVSVVQPEGIREDPQRSGVRFIVPFAEQLYSYPIYWQTYTMSGKPLEGQNIGDDSIVARTFDGQEVIIDCSVIFRLETEQVVRIHIDWQDRYIEDFVRPYVRGIVRTEVSQFTIDEINSFKRRDLETRLDELLREELASKGFVLDKFLLRNIAFSNLYAQSVEEKQVALQDITQREYQAEQIRQIAQGTADEIEIAAQAEANAIGLVSAAEALALQRIAEAVADNPDLLTYEYINKLSPNLRVMLVPSDNPYILNLPNVDEAMNGDIGSTISTPSVVDTSVLSPTITIAPTPEITTTIEISPTGGDAP